MSLSIIGSASASVNSPQLEKAASTPAPTQAEPASLPADTVTFSAAAMKVSRGGDVDHDGDSH
jgi:hypothetical protein